ncbi:hypothetical protein [Sorangium sp. So ce388]|uniref:hypothetical protein n=1 Tax=Sorangium sp. So ce388 TaxID=3133309 RepID=UPI003F5B2EBD
MSESDLPNGWMAVQLGDVIRGFESGRNLQSQGRPAKDGEYGVLKVSAVTWGSFRPEENKALQPGDVPRSHECVRAGDVLISRANTTELVGSPVIVHADYPHLMLPDKILRVLPVSDAIDSRFLVYALRTPAVRFYLEQEATGTSDSMRNLSQPKLAGAPLWAPPLAEQRRIVAKIETLSAKSRRAKEALDAIPALLERFRQSVLAAAFRGDLTADWREKNPDVEPAEELLKRIRAERRRRWEEAELAKMRAKGKVPGDDRWKERYEEPPPVDASDLPELPEGWCWAGLSEVAEIQLGQRRAPEYVGEAKFPYIRAANITWRGLDLSDVQTMGFAEPERLFLRPGDVLLNEASGSPTEVGKPAIWRGELRDCCFQATVLRIRSWSDELIGEWLYTAFLRDAILGNFVAMAPGVGILHLTAERMRNWPVPLAPSTEQRRLTEVVQALLVRFHKVSEILASLERCVTRCDASILAKAFRGELVPQDPNDEPASALLERLRAEATTNGQPTNGARRPRKPVPPESSKPSTTGRGRKPATSAR